VKLRRLRYKHNLLRLRVSMSYHRFSNLRELFQGHLNKVLLRNVDSEDLRDRPSNCPGRGSYNICRKALIVYMVKFPQTGKYYIGATLRKRVARHLQDTRKLLRAESSPQYPCQSSGTDVAAKQQVNSNRWHVAC
jgi:hypothetical protein